MHFGGRNAYLFLRCTGRVEENFVVGVTRTLRANLLHDIEGLNRPLRTRPAKTLKQAYVRLVLRLLVKLEIDNRLCELHEQHIGIKHCTEFAYKFRKESVMACAQQKDRIDYMQLQESLR